MKPFSQKFYSYNEAWDRINRALDQGFYFEAVTIEESILSSKIRRILYTHGTFERSEETKRPVSFNNLIQRWRNLGLLDVCHAEYTNLIDAVDEWRKQRNHIVHGIVRTRHEEEIADIANFIELARETAFKGRDINKAVEYWSRRHLRAFKKTAEERSES